MSNKINRNISLPLNIKNINSTFSNQSSIDECLGENIKDAQTPIYSLSTDNSDLEGVLDLGIKISGLSSSSSLSWSEEYESEINRKVQSELECLDRIFQGLDLTSSVYSIDEINEWKQHFPNLYILGRKTPTNSEENSSASSDSEEEVSTKALQPLNIAHRQMVFPRNRSSIVNKRRQDVIAHDTYNPSRNFNSLPRKPRSLEIERYLKISSIKSPDDKRPGKHFQQAHREPPPQKDPAGNVSPEFNSLPFITATSLKTPVKRRYERTKPGKMLILPPIENSFRSISATPRQVSSKSMFISLNYERNSSKKESQAAKLKSDLMKLFDHIPISNR